MSEQVLDVREILPRDRHPRIFDMFDNLAVGTAFILVNDHDPKPLYYQFAAERTGEFGWEYLEQGPSTWRVRVSRVAAPPAGIDRKPVTGCGCGGHDA